MTEEERDELMELRETVAALRANQQLSRTRSGLLRPVLVIVLLGAAILCAVGFTPAGAAVIAVLARCCWWLFVNAGPVLWRMMKDD